MVDHMIPIQENSMIKWICLWFSFLQHLRRSHILPFYSKVPEVIAFQ